MTVWLVYRKLGLHPAALIAVCANYDLAKAKIPTDLRQRDTYEWSDGTTAYYLVNMEVEH